MERKSGELVSAETIEALARIQNKREVPPPKPLPLINVTTPKPKPFPPINVTTPKSDDDLHVKVFKRLNSFPHNIDVDLPPSPIDIKIPSRK